MCVIILFLLQEFLVSVGVQGATLRHRMAKTGHSWIFQIMDYLDVKDYDILGYVLPKVLTELHIHLWNCAVDYRYVVHGGVQMLGLLSFGKICFDWPGKIY